MVLKLFAETFCPFLPLNPSWRGSREGGRGKEVILQTSAESIGMNKKRKKRTVHLSSTSNFKEFFFPSPTNSALLSKRNRRQELVCNPCVSQMSFHFACHCWWLGRTVTVPPGFDIWSRDWLLVLPTEGTN